MEVDVGVGVEAVTRTHLLYVTADSGVCLYNLFKEIE